MTKLREKLIDLAHIGGRREIVVDRDCGYE